MIADITYIEKQFASSSGVSLDYKELMTDLNLMPDGSTYLTYIEDEGTEDPETGEFISSLSENQQALNETIEKVKSFNVAIYYVIQTRNEVTKRIETTEVNSHNYGHIKINSSYYATYPEYTPPDAEVQSVPSSHVLSVMGSILFTNTQGISLELDSYFPIKNADGSILIVEGAVQRGSISSGDYFCVYLIVETVDGKKAEIAYKFIYVPELEKDDDDGNDEAENEKTFVADEFGGIVISDDRWQDYVFFNTVTLRQVYALPNQTLKLHSGIGRVYVSPLCPVQFTLSFNVISNGKTTPHTFTYTPKILKVSGAQYNRCTKMSNPDVSYELIRTNPKLTGNIKVVVDSKDDIYLDTFKVSDTLSDRKYRHIKVGYDSYYGSSVMKFFKGMPASELYKVEERCHTMFTTVQSYKDQYYDMYWSGAKTNDDKLYKENFALLAPLCVKRIVPDFFVVFKINKEYLKTHYNEYTEDMTDVAKLKYFLTYGTIVKTYDMRYGSKLGTYVRTIYDHASQFPGDIYESYDANNLNKYNGISIDRGEVATMYESGYKSEIVNNQVALNDFYTNAFERNKIISKDIINFEFMFDDESSDLFSLNTYFGFYIKVNTLGEDFSCIGIDEETGLVFDSSVYSFEQNDTRLSKTHAQLLYVMTTPAGLVRLRQGLGFSKEAKTYMLKPYKNLVNSHVRKINYGKIKNFIVFKINSPLEVGEHIRIIDTANKVIYEVITCDRQSASECDGYYVDEHNNSEVLTNYYNEYGSTFTIKRIGIYTYYRDNWKQYCIDNNEQLTEDEVKTRIITEQISQLYYAFREFYNDGAALSSYKKNENSLSLVGYVNQLLFERICAPSIFDDVMYKYVRTGEAEHTVMTFYGDYTANKTILDVNNVDSSAAKMADWKRRNYAYLYPMHFEFAGTRFCYIMPFLETSDLTFDGKLYACNIEDPKTVFNNKTILYMSNNPDYEGIDTAICQKIRMDCFANDSQLGEIYYASQYVDYIISYENLDEYIIRLNQPQITNNTISLYLPYKINHGLCSIFNVKDFDFTVKENLTAVNSFAGYVNVAGTNSEYNEKSVFNYSLGEIDPSEKLLVGMDLEETEETDYHGKIIEPTFVIDSRISRSDDSLLRVEKGDGEYELYIVAHCTLEDFVNQIKSVITYISNSESKLQEVDSNMHVITIKDLYNSLCNLIFKEEECNSKIDLEEMKGIIFRPYLGETKTYNTLYEYFDYYLPKTFTYDITAEWYDDENFGTWSGASSVYYPSARHLAYAFEEKTYDSNIFFESKSDYFDTYNPKLRANSTDGLEENFKNYIDKFNTFTDSSKNKSLFTNVGRSNVIQNRSTYLKYLYSNNHKLFDISLTSPYACKWKSTGTDARIEKLRLMYNTNKLVGNQKSYFTVGPDLYDSYLGILYLKERNSTKYNLTGEYNYVFNKYINRAFDDIIVNEDETLATEEFDNILYNNGEIDDILYDSKNTSNKFSIAHKSGENCLEFISGGVKFKLTSKNINILNLEQYNGYSICFINMPTQSKNGKKADLIIDETMHQMAYIWYSNTNSNRFGVKYSFENEDDAEQVQTDATSGLICTKINYTGTLLDVIPFSYLVDGYFDYSSQSLYSAASISALKIEDTMNFSDSVDEYPITAEFKKHENGAKTKFYRKGQQLCSSVGFLFLSNIGVDNNSYSKKHPTAISGKISNSYLLSRDYDQTFSYYDYNGNFIAFEPYIWHDNVNGQYNYHDQLSSESLDKYAYNYPSTYDTLLYTDDIDCIPSSIRTLDDLKTVSSKCGIYVKTAHGTYDYTTKTNLLTVDIIDPIEYSKYYNFRYDLSKKDETKDSSIYVHSTFAEPVTYDLLDFMYSIASSDESSSDNSTNFSDILSSLEDVFHLSFDGANLAVNDVKTIPQLWYNKYAETPNYCIKTHRESGTIKNMLFSIDVKENVSIFADSWINTKYYLYSCQNDYTLPTEIVSEIYGYNTGYELKTFFNTRSLSLNTDSIEITEWKDVIIDSKTSVIKINVTQSLIYKILNTPAFIHSWSCVNNVSSEIKTKYIKNHVLKYININNQSKFELRRNDLKYKVARFDTQFDDTKIEYKNFKNELKLENGMYYMYVYPEDKYAYCGKMTISLK